MDAFRPEAASASASFTAAATCSWTIWPAALITRVQLATDGHKAYFTAVEGAFGSEIDYAMLVKLFGASPDSAKGRYSPAECSNRDQCSQAGVLFTLSSGLGRTLDGLPILRSTVAPAELRAPQRRQSQPNGEAASL